MLYRIIIFKNEKPSENAEKNMRKKLSKNSKKYMKTELLIKKIDILKSGAYYKTQGGVYI